jgi:hypothetical protein
MLLWREEELLAGEVVVWDENQGALVLDREDVNV